MDKSLQGQNFKMITSARGGYILVWARVRSTRVLNSIHHEGRGCKRKRYKDQRESSFKMICTRDQIRNSVPTGTKLKYSVPLASGVNCKLHLKIETDRV